MRGLAAPVVLSSLALSGWLTGASAQEVGVQPPPAVSTAASETAVSQGNLAAGVLPQPTPENPGVVLGVTLGELYTDNLKLAGSGTPKESSFITQVEPFIKAAWGGPRFSGIVDYSLTGYLYAGQAHSHQLTQHLDARGSYTLVPQHFFIDGAATYQRATINNQLPTGAGAFFLNENHANIGTVSISPWWTQQFGNLGTAMVRYTHGRVMYNQHGIPDENSSLLAGVSDINSDALQAQLVSPEGLTVGWNFSYMGQWLEPDQGRIVKFAQAKAGTYWQVSPSLRLLADAGAENKYRPDGTTGTLDAPLWDIGFEWSTARDFVKLLVGHRFYGRSAELSWTHTASLLTTSVSYTERPTDLNQQFLGQGSISLVLPPSITAEIPSLAERQIYLMKRAMASATYQMPRGNLRLTLYDESRRFFTLDNETEKVANANLAWTIDLGPLTTFTPTYGWQRYKFRTGQVNYTHFAQLALVHQINAKNFGSLRVRNDSRNVLLGVPGAHDYRVNVVFLDWTHLF